MPIYTARGILKTTPTGDGNSTWGDSTVNNRAAVSKDGELITTVTERERSVWVNYQATSVAATKYSILIDLSDTTNWPHTSTGRVDLSVLRISLDRGNYSGSVRWGVITRVDGTNADISYFKQTYIDVTLGASFIEERVYTPNQIKLGTTGGALNFALCGVTETTASVNTGVALDSPLGATTVTPAVGDVIIKFDRTSGTLTNAALFALYHSEASAS